MTATSNTPGPGEADREAVDWLILLQDDPDNQEDRARFEAWLAEDPAHAVAWADIQLTAGLIDAVPPLHQAVWADEKRLLSPAEASARRRRGTARGGAFSLTGRSGRRALVVALTAAAACLVVVAAPTLSLRLQSDYVSGAGEMRTVRLEDGSEMRMAPGSAVSLAYGEGRRGVRLLRGQAYFEVQPNPARPFVVDAGEVETTVLGTGFEVRKGKVGAEVAVRHGRVRVEREQGGAPVAVRLAAGDRVTVSSTGGVLSRERPERVASWTQGDLIVSDRSVREVIAALRPWHSGVIVMTGRGLESRRVTGVYNLRDPEAALASLAQVHDLKVRRITPWITVVSAG